MAGTSHHNGLTHFFQEEASNIRCDLDATIFPKKKLKISIGCYTHVNNINNMLHIEWLCYYLGVPALIRGGTVIGPIAAGVTLPSSYLTQPLHSHAPDPSKIQLSPGGGGVLPYKGYIGTCRAIGYGFWGAQSLNRVSFFTLLFLCAWCGP